jgi:polyisoprenoid-binding protein YceI
MARWTTLALAPVLLANAPLAQDAKPYVKDAAHSQINFVAESRLLDAHGYFGDWDAKILLDQADWTKSSVEIVIKTASINTRIDRRDEHLKSADFFDAANHPAITFKSAIVNKLGDTRLNITGDLTIRGTTKRITVPATLVFFDAEKNTGRVKGTFTINRQDYGVKFQSPVNPIADEVQVQFDVAFKSP